MFDVKNNYLFYKQGGRANVGTSSFLFYHKTFIPHDDSNSRGASHDVHDNNLHAYALPPHGSSNVPRRSLHCHDSGSSPGLSRNDCRGHGVITKRE